MDPWEDRWGQLQAWSARGTKFFWYPLQSPLRGLVHFVHRFCDEAAQLQLLFYLWHLLTQQPTASVGIGSVSNNTCAMVTTWYMGYSHPLQNGSPYIHLNNYNGYIRGLVLIIIPKKLAPRHFLKQGRPGIVGDMYKNHSGASFPKSTTDLGF